MNHLAHLLLAGPDPLAMVGTLAADHLKGPPAGLPPLLHDAIVEHRKLDSFTDGHPAVRAARRLFAPDLRRFAGIALDVLYDHLLARHWEQYHPEEPLAFFASRVYGALQSHAALLPEPLRTALPRMVADDFLVRYRDRERVAWTLHRVARRLRRGAEGLERAAREADALYEPLEESFHQFFPGAARYALALRTETASRID